MNVLAYEGQGSYFPKDFGPRDDIDYALSMCGCRHAHFCYFNRITKLLGEGVTVYDIVQRIKAEYDREYEEARIAKLTLREFMRKLRQKDKEIVND